MRLRNLWCTSETASTCVAENFDKPFHIIDRSLCDVPLGINPERDEENLLRILVLLAGPADRDKMSSKAIERNALLLQKGLDTFRPDCLVMHMSAPSSAHLQICRTAVTAGTFKTPLIITIQENSAEFERDARIFGVHFYAVTPIVPDQVKQVLDSICSGTRNIFSDR